jgi:prepilin-type N-terminal cleavage/methylation domain-containing protein
MTSTKKWISLSRHGFGLIEVVVSIALVGILAGILTSVILNTLKVQKSIDEKFVLQDTKNFLVNAFANSAVCASQLGGPTLDLSTTTTTSKYPADVSYTLLRSGSLPTSPILAEVGHPLPGSHLVVDTITLKDIYKSGAGNSFQGTLEIAIVPSTLTLSRKPITMTTVFTASTPLTAANFISCMAEGSGFKGIPQPMGLFTGVYNGMNMQVYPIFVNVSGGNAPVSGDDANTCSLAAQVQSVTVASMANNNNTWAKQCSISFWVPANAAYQVHSDPYPVGVGTGKFNVIESR